MFCFNKKKNGKLLTLIIVFLFVKYNRMFQCSLTPKRHTCFDTVKDSWPIADFWESRWIVKIDFECLKHIQNMTKAPKDNCPKACFTNDSLQSNSSHTVWEYCPLDLASRVTANLSGSSECGVCARFACQMFHAKQAFLTFITGRIAWRNMWEHAVLSVLVTMQNSSIKFWLMRDSLARFVPETPNLARTCYSKPWPDLALLECNFS